MTISSFSQAASGASAPYFKGFRPRKTPVMNMLAVDHRVAQQLTKLGLTDQEKACLATQIETPHWSCKDSDYSHRISDPSPLWGSDCIRANEPRWTLLDVLGLIYELSVDPKSSPKNRRYRPVEQQELRRAIWNLPNPLFYRHPALQDAHRLYKESIPDYSNTRDTLFSTVMTAGIAVKPSHPIPNTNYGLDMLEKAGLLTTREYSQGAYLIRLDCFLSPRAKELIDNGIITLPTPKLPRLKEIQARIRRERQAVALSTNLPNPESPGTYGDLFREIIRSAFGRRSHLSEKKLESWLNQQSDPEFYRTLIEALLSLELLRENTVWKRYELTDNLRYWWRRGKL